MITKKENSDMKKNVFPVCLIFLTSSLIIGFTDILVSILFTPRFPGFSFILEPLSITVIFFFFLQIILYMVIVLPFYYFFKTKVIDIAVLFSSFFVFFIITGSAADVLGFSFAPEQIFKLSLVFVVAIISSAALSTAVKAISKKEAHKKRLISTALSLPFLFAGILVFYWLIIYGTVPFLTKKFFLIGFLFLLFMIFTLWIFNFVLNYKTKSVIVMLFWLAAVFSRVFSPSFSPPPGLKNIPVKEGSPKYIFLVTVDCLRTDAVSCYNSKRNLTPNISEFAREAVVFEQAFSPSSWTLPAVASLMTGFSPSIHAVTADNPRLPDQLPTMAGELKKNGYYTCAIGINPNLTKRTNISKGFLYYDFYPKYAVERAIGSKILKHLSGFYTAENVLDLAPGNVVFDWSTLINTQKLTDLCIGWIGKNKSKHFFLWIHYLDPHVPYGPPLEYLEKKETIPAIGFNFDKAIDVLSGAFVPSEKEKKWMKTLYDGEIRCVDDNLGRLFKALKQMGIYNDSLVILTTDHGEEFWDHGRYYHGHSMYNEVISVPLIIKCPGGKQQERVEPPVSLNNIMPTILEYCNIKLEKKEYYANSLHPFLHLDTGNNYTPQPIKGSGVLYGEEREALFFDRYKYIISGNNQKEELFDLHTDPLEQNCLNEKMPEKLQEARETLKKQTLISNKIRQLFKITGDQKSEKAKNKSKETDKLKSLGYL